MLNEIQELINDIKESAQSDPNRVVDFEGKFNLSVINILWAIVGGKRFHRHDEEFKKLLSCVDQFLKTGNVVRGNIPVPDIIVRLFPSISKRFGLNTSLFHSIQQFISVRIFLE